MKKYVVRNKTTQQVFGKFDTQNQASEKLVEYITEKNDDVCSDEDGFLSIFDFDVQEEEVQMIASYEEAKRYLNIPSGLHIVMHEANPNLCKALLALHKLFTIAEAWNKEDGFVPDFNDARQYKYSPLFEYSEDAAGFVCADASWAATYANASVGSRLCFSTCERAFDFGKKFESLYNDFLLLDK